MDWQQCHNHVSCLFCFGPGFSFSFSVFPDFYHCRLVLTFKMNFNSSSKLETLCLNVIISNFERFFLAYINNNENMQMPLQFLQKKYCNIILEKLANCYRLKTHHLNFVINKYTKELDFRIFLNKCDYEEFSKKVLEFSNCLTKVVMPNMRNFEEINKFLKNLPAVEELDIKQSNVGDLSLSIIAETCLKLKKLDLWHCFKVTDEGIKNLCQSQLCLESLNLGETSVSFKGLAYVLKHMPSLTELLHKNVGQAVFEAVGLNDTLTDNLKASKREFNLKSLEVLNNPLRPTCHLTNVLKACAMSCSNVTNLTVADLTSEEHLQICCLFKNLEVVTLGCSPMLSMFSINNFLRAQGSKIRILRLTLLSFSVKVLAESCPKLEDLSLKGPIFEDFQDDEDLVLPNLKTFNLESYRIDSSINNESVNFIITKSPNLSNLGIMSCALSSELMTIIATLPQNLQFLNLNSTLVDVNFVMEVLRQHPTLTKIAIENSGINSAQYDDLLDMTEDMGYNVDITWADYCEAIRELFLTEHDSFRNYPSQLLKL